MIYRPIRERSVHDTLEAIEDILAATGYGEVGLVSLSSSDHSGIREIIARMLEKHAADDVGISLPSLRIDSFSVELAQMIASRRKSGFTFAPEAGSQRLRDVINKGVTEEDLMVTAQAAFENGWNRIKLYFMLGLPTETDEDVDEIIRLTRTLADMGRRIRRRPVSINVSAAVFVPKPHTPFQWESLADRETIERRQQMLFRALRGRNIKVSTSCWDATWLEAILSRGDRRLGRVILDAWRRGARFCAWGERFRPELWRDAMEAQGLSGADYVSGGARGESTPWSHIDVGVTDEFLADEMERAIAGDLSPDCRQDCHNCGILSAYAEERQVAGQSVWGCP